MANPFLEYEQQVLAKGNQNNRGKKRDWYAEATGSGAKADNPSSDNDTINNGFFGHLKDAADAGAAGSVAGAARFAQEFIPFGNEWFGEVADDMDKIVQRNTPLQPLEGTDWVAGAVGNALGSGLPSLIGGAVLLGVAGAVGATIPAATAVGVYKAARHLPAIGKLVKLTRQMWKSPFGKLALAETAGSGVEGITEAGNLITEMRNEGYSDEDIRTAALESASLNTAWLTVANMVGGNLTAKYGKEAVKGGLKQMTKNAGKGALLEGSSEGVQEFGQSLIGNEAKGEEYDYEQAGEAAAQAFVGSGILGGIGGAAAPYINEAPATKTKTETSEANTEEPTKAESTPEAKVPKVSPEVQNARNAIIDHRETLDEDAPEYSELTEILENGNDEEIVDVANMIKEEVQSNQEVAASEVKPEPPKSVVKEKEKEVKEQTATSIATESSVAPAAPVVTSPAQNEQVREQNTVNGETQPEVTGQEEQQKETTPPVSSAPEVKPEPPKTAKNLKDKLPKAALVEFDKAEKNKGKDFDFNEVYDKIVSPIYAAHNNKEISDQEKKELLEWVKTTVKGWQTKEPSVVGRLDEKAIKVVNAFKERRRNELRVGLRTKSEAIGYFRNYFKKYMKQNHLAEDQIEDLAKEYEKEFGDYNFKSPLTKEEVAQLHQNLQKRQSEVLGKIKKGEAYSREEVAKMRDFINELPVDSSQKHSLMVEFNDGLKGLIDGLRLKQKRRRGSRNAPIQEAEIIERQINDIDSKLRNGKEVTPQYLWTVRKNIGKNEDLGIFTKEQADKFYDDLDKVIRDAERAEINATGGKPEVATPEVKPEPPKPVTNAVQERSETKPPKPNKFAVVKNEVNNDGDKNKGDMDANNGDGGKNDGGKNQNDGVKEASTPKPNKFSEKVKLNKLAQDTKALLEKLESQKDIDFKKVKAELFAPYEKAIADGIVTKENAAPYLDRIEQRLTELEGQRVTESMYDRGEEATTQQEAIKDKEDGGKPESDKPKTGNKFIDRLKSKPKEQDGDKANNNPPSGETPAQEPQIPPPNIPQDTPEVKAAKEKIFQGISSLFKKIGVVLVTDPQRLANAVKSSGFKNAYVTKDGLVWAENDKGEGGYINGLASSDGKTIYIPKNRLSPKTAVHEFTHLWSAIVQKNNPVLWARGVKLMKRDAADLWFAVKNKYPHLKTDDQIADEVISRLSEAIFEKKLNKSMKVAQEKPTIKQWIKKYWKSVKHFLGLDNKSLQEMTLEDFRSMPIQSLFDAKTLVEIATEHKSHAGKLTYDSAFRERMKYFKQTTAGKKLLRDFNDKELEVLKEVFSAVGNKKDIDLFVNTSGRDNKYAVMINNVIVHEISRAQVNAIQYFTKAMKGYGELLDADIIEVDEVKLREKVLNTNLVTEFLASKAITDLAKMGGSEGAEKFLRSKVQGQALHKIIQNAYSKDIGTGERDNWDAFTYALDELDLKNQQINAIEGYYKYLKSLYKKLDIYLAGGEEFEHRASFEYEESGIPVDETKYSATGGGPSVESRLRNAVTTIKPTTVKEDIANAGGKEGWLNKQWRKFYRAWVDKNVDIKDFDVILQNALGRALTAGESIYNRVQMVSSKASGFAYGLIEGDEKHLKALNEGMERKPMKYAKATLANVLDIVNAEKMNKLAPDYLAKYGFNDWTEAVGTYLGWRRLAEMARLKREAFEEEHAEWTARKRAYEAWANSGRIGDNPQVAAYKEWEAYQKAKKNAQARWSRNGKIGPNPAEDMKAKWLATHKDEEAPKKYVGKEPVFEAYDMPQGLTESDVLKAIKEAPAPFAEAANLYYKLNDNILSIMEDAGMISPELHELLNTKYKDYCPMIRDFSDTAAVDSFIESITAGGKGVANVSSMIKKIREEGSKRTIINPLESTLQTIAAVTNRAERNKAGQHLVRMMVSAPELKGQIRKLEQPKYGTISADPKNCIFTVMFNGKKVAYQSDPEYYQAIVGYNLPTSSLLLRVPQTVAKTLRTGATMSPSFIVRNIFRDTITAGIASKNGFIPIIDTIRGAKALWSDPDFRAQFEAAGIVSFNQYGGAESAYRNLTALGSGKNYTVYEPKQIIQGVLQAVLKGKGMEALKTAGISFEQLSSFAESATRAGEFKKAMDAGKSMSEAAYDAKEVTLDFSRSGIAGQSVNRVIPFFNACIQGGDKMIRLFYENPTGTALRVAQYIVLPSLALWLLNHDEDWYEELDPAVKYTHWCLPNGIRVPKPQEYGILFGGSIEAMLDQAVLNDRRAMKEWVDSTKDVITPSVLPTIMLPLLEWVTNYSFFKGRDLVPQRLQRLPDELQYSTGTSELSKFVGKHTYTSPVKIDNLVRGYTGTMGMFLWQTPDWFAAEKQGLPAKKVSEMQFIRDFNVTDVVRNRYVNDFYELQEKANQQQAGYGVKGKPSAAVKAIRKAGKVINDLNKNIRTVEASDKYTPERKRELIDKMRERINNTAKIVVKKYGDDFL